MNNFARYDVILVEKELEGLTAKEIQGIVALFSLNGVEEGLIPCEFNGLSSSAIGFMTETAESYIADYSHQKNFERFVFDILSDVKNENPNGAYRFGELTVCITRDIPNLGNLCLQINDNTALIAETGFDADYKEIYIGLVKDKIWWQDLAIVRLSEDAPNQYEVLVYADSKNEDYTNRYVIQEYADFENKN